VTIVQRNIHYSKIIIPLLKSHGGERVTIMVIPAFYLNYRGRYSHNYMIINSTLQRTLLSRAHGYSMY